MQSRILIAITGEAYDSATCDVHEQNDLFSSLVSFIIPFLYLMRFFMAFIFSFDFL